MSQINLPTPRPSSISTAVLWTVVWFDVFGQVLTGEEVQRWLMGFRASKEEVKLALREHPLIRKVEHETGEYYCLEGKEDLVSLRLNRERVARRFWERVENKEGLFKVLPHLRCVCVANSLAFGYPDADSDIDLFVITARERIWSVRVALTTALHLRGVRRHKAKIAGRFCLSFFLSEERMSLEGFLGKELDPYLAQWVLSLVPVYDEGDCIYRFWGENMWAREYFPNFELAIKRREGLGSGKFEGMRKKVGEAMYNKVTEKVIRKVMFPRTRRKMEKLKKPHDTVVSDEVQKFHETMARRDYYKKWVTRLSIIDPQGELPV